MKFNESVLAILCCSVFGTIAIAQDAHPPTSEPTPAPSAAAAHSASSPSAAKNGRDNHAPSDKKKRPTERPRNAKAYDGLEVDPD